MSTKPQLPFSASMAADELHCSLDLSQPHGVVLRQFTAALQAAYDRGRADARASRQERIVDDILLSPPVGTYHGGEKPDQ